MKDWVQFLQRKGLDGLVAALLEAAGPLTLLLAQGIYLGQPFLGQLLPVGQWEVLAHLLEDREESRTFISFLRQEELR